MLSVVCHKDKASCLTKARVCVFFLHNLTNRHNRLFFRTLHRFHLTALSCHPLLCFELGFERVGIVVQQRVGLLQRECRGVVFCPQGESAVGVVMHKQPQVLAVVHANACYGLGAGCAARHGVANHAGKVAD